MSIILKKFPHNTTHPGGGSVTVWGREGNAEWWTHGACSCSLTTDCNISVLFSLPLLTPCTDVMLQPNKTSLKSHGDNKSSAWYYINKFHGSRHRHEITAWFAPSFCQTSPASALWFILLGQLWDPVFCISSKCSFSLLLLYLYVLFLVL